MSEWSEVVEESGDYRVKLVADYDAEKPDGDAFGFVFRVERGSADLMHDTGKEPAPDLNRALERWGCDWEKIERYMRQAYDAVAFDSFDTRDATYLEVVTRHQAVEVFGNDPDSDLSNCADLSEWRAWAEGDVYGVVVEKRVHWSADDADFEDRDTWEEVDSCWGYYGHEYATQEARAELADHAGVKA